MIGRSGDEVGIEGGLVTVGITVSAHSCRKAASELRGRVMTNIEKIDRCLALMLSHLSSGLSVSSLLKLGHEAEANEVNEEYRSVVLHRRLGLSDTISLRKGTPLILDQIIGNCK